MGHLGSHYKKYILKGADDQGIVNKVSNFFSNYNLNIIEVNTFLESAPITGSPLFNMEVTISYNNSNNIDEINCDLNNTLYDDFYCSIYDDLFYDDRKYAHQVTNIERIAKIDKNSNGMDKIIKNCNSGNPKRIKKLKHAIIINIAKDGRK